MNALRWALMALAVACLGFQDDSLSDLKKRIAVRDAGWKTLTTTFQSTEIDPAGGGTVKGKGDLYIDRRDGKTKTVWKETFDRGTRDILIEGDQVTVNTRIDQRLSQSILKKDQAQEYLPHILAAPFMADHDQYGLYIRRLSVPHKEVKDAPPPEKSGTPQSGDAEKTKQSSSGSVPSDEAMSPQGGDVRKPQNVREPALNLKDGNPEGKLDDIVVELAPREEKDSTLKVLRMYLDTRTLFANRIEAEYASGRRWKIVIRAIKTNVAMPDYVFTR